IGFERDLGSGTLGRAHFLDIADGIAALIFLHVNLAAAAHLGLGPFAQRGDRLGAHAVQTGGCFVSALVEFRACANRRHDQFERGSSSFTMNVNGNAAAIVADGYAAVEIDLYLNIAAIAAERFINTVINQLIDQMVQSLRGGIADIHAGILPDMSSVAQYLYILPYIVFGCTFKLRTNIFNHNLLFTSDIVANFFVHEN